MDATKSSRREITVRSATEDDVDAIVPLIEAQYAEHAIERTRDEIAAGVRGLVEVPARGVILLAHRHGALVGVAVVSFTWSLENGGHTAWLDELYVTEAARGGGVGSALLEAVIARADEEGCLGIELEVDHEHARAERLYARHGFRPLPRRRFTLARRDRAAEPGDSH